MRYLLLTVLLAAIPVAAAPSAETAVETAVRALEARYRSAKTLKAVFLESYSDGGGSKSAESGTVYFSRPGRMRWDYESPEKKLFLVDGTNVWLYVPADRTASRAKLKESSDWRTPLALLVGKADLRKMCRGLQIVASARTQSAADGQSDSAGDMTLRCIPRDTPRGDTSQQVLLEMNPEDYLVRVVIHEPGNLITEFRFGNWQENIPLPESAFHFRPPAGVSIVDEQSLLGEGR
jgi:outer membrane lipoprotein carrier protein